MSNKVQTENKNTDNRSDKIKLYSIGAVVLLIGILIVVNVLFEKILGKALTFDSQVVFRCYEVLVRTIVDIVLIVVAFKSD